MIEAFKTLRGINNVDKTTWFRVAENDAPRPNTRSNTNVEGGKEEDRPCVLFREEARTELRNNTFRFRVGRKWNDLPDHVRLVKTTNSFKNAYDNWRRSNNNNNP